MSDDTTYQVYFTGRNGRREFLNEDFVSEDMAQEAVEQLIDQGFEDATYDGYSFSIEY